jgi:ferredoxin
MSAPARGPAGGSVRAGAPRASQRLADQGVSPGLRLVVNPIACEAHGLCAELLPELISLDEWGYPVIDERAIPHHLESLARRAVSACPTLALRLAEAAARQ